METPDPNNLTPFALWLHRTMAAVKNGIKPHWKWHDYILLNMNAHVHSLGGMLSLLLTFFLVRAAGDDPSKFWGSIIFGISACVLFASSSMMHYMTESFHLPKRIDKFLTRLDFTAIFLLIAGSYTPVLLVAIQEPWRSRLLTVLWGFALIGVLFTQVQRHLPRWTRHRKLRVAIYLVMGWSVAIRLPELYNNLPIYSFLLIAAEGAIYTLGAWIYVQRAPNPWPKYFGYHQIWHILVVLGVLCHGFALLAMY